MRQIRRLLQTRWSGQAVNMPQVFFMHIPKTAGSSVHAALSAHFPQERVPNSFMLAWRDPERFKKYDFLGGHVARNNFTYVQLVSGLEENYRTISFVRRPQDQLASHLAWVRHLSDPENEDSFEQTFPAARNLSRNLQKVDFSDPADLKRFFETMGDMARSLFDNCMARYFETLWADQKMTKEHAEKAVEAMAFFECIGVVERYEDSMNLINHIMGWPKPEKLDHRNALPQRYGLDISDERILEVFEPYIKYDKLIYAAAVKRLEAQLAEHDILPKSVSD
ncbi:MAG: hypothetical protein AAGC95_11165 [Pseudomonadota bacterium]